METFKYDRWDMFKIRFICKSEDFLFMLNFQDRIMSFKISYAMPSILPESIKAQ